MAVFPWNSAYLLTKLKEYINRPTADMITDAQYYLRLTDAQMQVVTDIATVIPEVLYPTVGYASIPTLTTTDHQTFTFGLDANGAQLSPMGSVGIYRSLSDIPYSPMCPGIDFIPLGGTAIQVPGNNTYTGTLYWRGISPPGEISATAQPVLFPEGARELISMRAALTFLRVTNPEQYALLAPDYGYPLAKNPGRFAYWCQSWKTQFRGGGALASVTGMQVAVGSAQNFAGF